MDLFFDVDGVLLNFEHSFVAFLNREYSLGLAPDYETPSWTFEELFSLEEAQAAWHRYMESGDCGRMAPLVEPRAFNALATGHRVHLLTNFPTRHMEKRQANLAALGFAFQSLHHCGLHVQESVRPPTKADLVQRLRRTGHPALFVDDHPENCLDVLRNCPGVEVWLMSRGFNRDFHHPAIVRTEGWPELIRRLEAPNGRAAAGVRGR